MHTCHICQHGYSSPFSLGRHVQNIHKARGAPSAPISVQLPTVAELQMSTTPMVFQHPFTMTLSGPTGSGKTMFFLNVIRHKKITPMPDRIVYLYKRWQPLYDQMKEEFSYIEFIKGIPSDLDNDSFFDVKKKKPDFN